MNHRGCGGHQLKVDAVAYDDLSQAVLFVPLRHVRPTGVGAISIEAPREPDPRHDAVLQSLAIADAAGGDELAFARIVAAYHQDMVRVCYVITRDADSANDAVQEAWSKAWRQLRSLRDRSRIRQWLIAIAANEARQIMRRQRRRAVTELYTDRPGDDDEGTQVWSTRVDLRNALAHLSVADRELLALRYVAGFDSFELSKVTGLSPSGTRARLQRLLTLLREELEPSNG